MNKSVLANLVWHSLSGEHANLAQGGAMAKRYFSEVAPFAALLDESELASNELLELMAVREQVCLMGQRMYSNDALQLVSQSYVLQMVKEGVEISAGITDDLRTLEAADVPQMVALTNLVFPHYFRPGTIKMGRYMGVFDDGQLIAMAGERLVHLPLREISSVCTHPNHQRRGYAAKITQCLMQRMHGLGHTPFLHVGEQNVIAQSLYENLGFRVVNRVEINLYQRT